MMGQRRKRCTNNKSTTSRGVVFALSCNEPHLMLRQRENYVSVFHVLQFPHVGVNFFMWGLLRLCSLLL